MLIRGIEKLALNDYPGKVSTTIGLFGCNFLCPYCYNHEFVKSENPELISEDELFKFLKERIEWYDGVCLSGGEPTVHKDLPEFISRFKELGLLVKLDTNGARPEMLEQLIQEKLIDYVAMDIKAGLDKYEKVVGRKVNKNEIQRSVDLIRKDKIDYEFRTTAVPGLFNEEDALSIGKWLSGSKKYFLQQFRSDKSLLDKKYEGKKPYSVEELERFKKILEPYFEYVGVRG